LSPHQFSHFVLITNSTTLVLHTCHTPTLTLFDFNDEVLSPTIIAEGMATIHSGGLILWSII
jgi:hypothetical protein